MPERALGSRRRRFQQEIIVNCSPVTRFVSYHTHLSRGCAFMATTTTPALEGTRLAATVNNAGFPTEFRNEPSTDFSNPEIARRMRAAIEKVRNELGREY